MIRFICFLSFIFFSSFIFSQDVIQLQNPSFEDKPRQGVYYMGNLLNKAKNEMDGWIDCGWTEFSNESAPDIHSASTNFWSVSHTPSHGETFLGLSVRDNDTWESVGQYLDRSLEKGKCYAFTIDLSQAETFLSGSRASKNENNEVEYSKPIVLRVWGGQSNCNKGELLYESEPIDHNEWKTYDIQVIPKESFRYITFQAFYKIPVVFPYNGHIMVDNISEIVEVECKE